MTFSVRNSQHDAPNPLARAVRDARARAADGGHALLDLTASNPTSAGIPYATTEILAALADPRGLLYEPEPLGIASARAAVARDWTARGTAMDPSRIALTASTSEAYAVLFKVLCDPGDEILVPAPSYPLLGFLAAFESVSLKPYPLVYAGGWHVDLDALKSAIGARTKAIIVVTPNTPTGSYLGVHELDAMLDLGLPIVSDEVFATYPLRGSGPPEGRIASVATASRGLVFALSGLSKLAGLPQMKLGWIGVSGEASLVANAMARLELVLDAYLSVAAPVQHALPTLLATRSATEQAIRARTARNLETLQSAMKSAPTASVLEVEGGWYAIVRVPDVKTDEEWTLELVTRDGVHVQPGYFFDMGRGAHLVVSLLTPEATFAEGITRVAARVAEHR